MLPIVVIGNAGQDDITVFDGGMGHLIRQKDFKLASLQGQQCDKVFLIDAYANLEQPVVVESQPSTASGDHNDLVCVKSYTGFVSCCHVELFASKAR